MSARLLVLSDSAVKSVLGYRECADAMREALIARACGDFYQPLRSVYPTPDGNGLMVLMPAYQSNVDAGYGLKSINVVPGNPARGLDSHQGIVLLSKSETGEPIALLNASAVTGIRTAAVSAVATSALANADADVLTIIGTGVQAESHLRAIGSTRDLAEIRIVGRTPEKAERFATDHASDSTHGAKITNAKITNAKIVGYASAEEALAGAGIVVTATNSPLPVIRREWLSPGTHINAVGACLPHLRELDSATVADAAFFGDSRESVVAEAGDFVLAIADGAIGQDHLRAELGDVLAGKATGRTGEREITIFESLGLAAEDIAAAATAYRLAVERGIGTMVDFG